MDEIATIHIVDDDASLRSALDSLFRSTGFKTRMFAAPAEYLANPPKEDAATNADQLNADLLAFVEGKKIDGAD